jgi:hypothetical protein
MEETVNELGGELGIALFRSLGTAIYRHDIGGQRGTAPRVPYTTRSAQRLRRGTACRPVRSAPPTPRSYAHRLPGG